MSDALQPHELSTQETESIKNTKQKQGNLLAIERDDTRALMSTAQGRRTFYRMLNISGLNANPFTGDDNKTNYLCGRMAVGQEQRNLALRWCPEDYLLMLKEANPKETTND